AAFASDAPVYSPSPCAPVATCSPSPPVPVCAPVCGPVGEGVAVETNVGTACPGGVCSLNVNVGTACPGGVCPLGANACENGRCETDVGAAPCASGFCSVAVGSNVGVGGAKKVRAWSRTVSRCGQTGFARTSFVRNICAARQTASSRRAVATVVVRSTGTCATATAAPPLPCAPVCR
ncbi:MAG: hypothetical protein IJO40_12105, partial [Thermoguttaceae bacterium]|nr:hypothetical protein [Thermoguttaceae bacterium]